MNAVLYQDEILTIQLPKSTNKSEENFTKLLHCEADYTSVSL